jgi:hypothetical protein
LNSSELKNNMVPASIIMWRNWMALWGLVIIVLPISIFISLLASVRLSVRDTVVRHPVAAARTFLSVSVALLLTIGVRPLFFCF